MEKKIKEKRCKESYSIAQIGKDDRAVLWEIKLCKMLELEIQQGNSLGSALLTLPEEYRWASCRKC